MADLPTNYVDGQIVHGPEVNTWMAAVNAASRYLGAVASQSAMLTLVGKPGDFCLRTDLPDMFYLVGSPPTSIAAWQASDASAEKTSNKNQPNGYAGLDGGGKVAAAQLPSYVDDVLEYANLAGFPSTGQQTGVIYVADDTGKAYRWSGSAYIEISASPGSTDSVSEGSVNLYFTNARADARADARVIAAVTDHVDGTLSVTGVNSLEPLSTVTILTASTAPAIGQTTYYNATSGNLTPTLPALSGLRVGARLAVRRDPADVSQNTVTLNCAGSDTFYSSGATTATLPMSGEQREYQVISQSGTKYWSPAGSLNPVAALDQRYLADTSKLVNIVDNGWGTSVAANAASTAGTSEMMFKVGMAATDISVLFNHWYTSTSFLDTDPAGPITFSASLKVVSSTNPGTTTGTIYRLTFNGRTTATLDPGGRIISDLLGVSLAAGDVVAIRTYLSSGTAYGPRLLYNLAGQGGFTAASDLTAPGSAAIAASSGAYYGPSAVLGYPTTGISAKSVLLIGDSIAGGGGDTGSIYSDPTLQPNNYAVLALSGIAGLINLGIAGDRAALFQITNGSFRRLSNAIRANSAIIEYGTNDIVNGVTAAQLEAIVLNIATNIRRMGIGKVVLQNLVPRTTSTDNWATTTNQTPLSNEAQRVLYNNWVRANCPIDPTALTPVAVGTAGALVAGQSGHPFTGILDVCGAVESAVNSGLWLPANRVTTGSMTSGGSTLTSAGASFVNATVENGGDIGATAFLAGAGASGATLQFTLASWANSTTMFLNAVAATTVSNTTLVINTMTYEGTHPSPLGHYKMSLVVRAALALL